MRSGPALHPADIWLRAAGSGQLNFRLRKQEAQQLAAKERERPTIRFASNLVYTRQPDRRPQHLSRPEGSDVAGQQQVPNPYPAASNRLAAV